MRLLCVGGGPAGLTFAILAGKAGHQVTVIEQQPPSQSFGFGVVFWNDLLAQLDRHDAETAQALRADAYRWTDQVIRVGDRGSARFSSSGYSIGRRTLLECLRRRAREVGVEIQATHFSGAVEQLDADLVVVSEGSRSALREQEPAFGTTVSRLRNRYLWLGTDAAFPSFTFTVEPTPAGWVWAHAYGFDSSASTFLVEMTPETWSGLGYSELDTEATLRSLEAIFAPSLAGHRLRLRAGRPGPAPWARFPVVANRRWSAGRLVLVGDAAHTTHFTIGSGTRLAMEDAMALASALAAEYTQDAALNRYETQRRRELRRPQKDALRSARWFERLPQHVGRSPEDFATLLHRRRSPALTVLPPAAYLALTSALDRMPALAAPIRRAVSKF